MTPKWRPPHTYFTLVWPILEYATIAWDPYQQYLINNIVTVQRRTARWVKQEYNLTASVTFILNNLKWSTLSKHWQYSRLILFLNFYTKTHLSSEYLIIIYPLHCLIAHNQFTIYIIFHHPHLQHISKRVSSLVPLLIGIIYLIKWHVISFHSFLEITWL